MKLGLGIAILAFLFLIIFSVFSVSAAAPAVTIAQPSHNSYVFSDFTLSTADTGISSNCSYIASYTNGTIIAQGSMNDSSTTQEIVFPFLSLPGGYNITINVSCMNATNSTETNYSTVNVLRDYVCGENVTTNWTLGHDFVCNGTALGIVLSSVNLSCGGKTLTGNYTDQAGYGLYLPQSVIGAAVKDCRMAGFYSGIHASGFNYNLTITNNTFYHFLGSAGTDHASIFFYGGAATAGVRIFGNSFANSTAAAIIAKLLGSSNITSNSFYNTSYGVYGLSSNINLLVRDNIMANITYYGIDLEDELNDSKIINNTIEGIGTGYAGLYMFANWANQSNNNITDNRITGFPKGLHFRTINNNALYGFNVFNNNVTAAETSLTLEIDNILTANIYHNNFLGASNVSSTVAINLDYNEQGNYWGHSSCPSFSLITDTDNPLAVDRYSYLSLSNWTTGGSPSSCDVATVDAIIDSVFERGFSLMGAVEASGVYELTLLVNVTNATNNLPAGVGVNITGADSICDGFGSSEPMQYMGDGRFNLTCIITNPSSILDGAHPITANAYLYNGMRQDSLDFIFYKDTSYPTIRFSWWSTFDAAGDPITLPYYKNFSRENDIFFSPNELVLNFTLNATDEATTNMSNVTAVQVQFDFGDYAKNGTCNNGSLVDMAFSESDGLWHYNCTLDAFDRNDVNNSVVSITANFWATDSFGNDDAQAMLTYNTSDPGVSVCTFNEAECISAFMPINLHDFGVPDLDSECLRFEGSVTNLTNVDNFNTVNLELPIEVNLSCELDNPLLPSTFRRMVYFNFSSLDFGSPATGAKLGALMDAIDFSQMALPRTFGDQRIYVNTTAFSELNTSTTIILSYLPFASMPNVFADLDAAGLSGAPAWVTNGFTADMGVVTGNLTFTVDGFSGYDVGDNVSPIISITNPILSFNTSAASVLVNVTINGTGSQVSAAYFLVNGMSVANFSNGLENSANCTNISNGSDTFKCIFYVTSAVEGVKNLSIIAYDYGGDSPGNNATGWRTYTYDLAGPVVTVTRPTNNGFTNTSFNFTATDALLSSCWYVLGNGTSSSVACNQEFSIPGLQEGYNNITLFANDTLSNNGTSGLVNFTVDTTAPVVSLIAPLQNTTTNSSTSPEHIFNVTDAMSNNFTCVFAWINNASGANASTYTNVTNATNYTISPLYGLYNGNITWHVNCTDLAGNMNTSGARWYLVNDTTVPVLSGASPSGSLASSTTSVTLSITTDEAASCRYSTSSTANFSAMTSNFTDSVTAHTASYSVASDTSYTLYVRCADVSNNTNNESTAISFSVDAAASGGSPGSSGGGSSSAAAPTAIPVINGTSKKVNIARYGVYKFSIMGSSENHTIRVKAVSLDSITFTLESTPVDITLKKGESREVDLTSDGKPDVNVMLDSWSENTVTFALTKIEKSAVSNPVLGNTTGSTILENATSNATIPVESAAAQEETTAASQEQANMETKAKKALSPLKVWLWVIGLSLLIIIVAILTLKRKKKEEMPEL